MKYDVLTNKTYAEAVSEATHKFNTGATGHVRVEGIPETYDSTVKSCITDTGHLIVEVGSAVHDYYVFDVSDTLTFEDITNFIPYLNIDKSSDEYHMISVNKTNIQFIRYDNKTIELDAPMIKVNGTVISCDENGLFVNDLLNDITGIQTIILPKKKYYYIEVLDGDISSIQYNKTLTQITGTNWYYSDSSDGDLEISFTGSNEIGTVGIY